MKESYRKGVANRPGPEPRNVRAACEGSRKDALEALDRGTRNVRTACRLGHGAPKRAFQGADVVRLCGRPRHSVVIRETVMNPAESKTPSMHGSSMRENRETPRLPVVVCHGPEGESDEL